MIVRNDGQASLSRIAAGRCIASRDSRRGITIIETIVLMTALAAILGLCVLMLQLLMKLDGESRTRLERANSFTRLAEQFRADVHAASTARLVDKPDAKNGVLRIERAPDRSVEYSVKGEGTIVRIESKHGKTERHERYELPGCGLTRLAIEKDDSREFAALRVNLRSFQAPTDPPRVAQVLALVAKNKDRVTEPARTRGANP
jgi:hypothetical protein